MSSAWQEKNPLSRTFDLVEYRLQLGSYGAPTLDLVVSSRVSQKEEGRLQAFFEQASPLYYS
jgi:hypothetical protein